MAFVWEKFAPLFQGVSEEDAWNVHFKILEKANHKEAEAGEAYWEAMRREVYEPLNHDMWRAMAKVSVEKWSAEDFLVLLEVVSEEFAGEGEEEYYFEGLRGWDVGFAAMLKKRGEDLGPLRKGWEKLREPVRSAAAVALVCHGALELGALPADTLGTMARRVVRLWGAEQAASLPGLLGLWPSEVWGRALIEAALVDVPYDEMPQLWCLLPHWELATQEERVRLLSRVGIDSAAQKLDLCLALGPEARPALEAEARRLIADPDYAQPYSDMALWGTCLGLALSEMYRKAGEASPLWLDELWAAPVMASLDLTERVKAELAHLPMERRRSALRPVLQMLADKAQADQTIYDERWSYVGLLQLPEAAQDAVDLILALGRGVSPSEAAIRGLRELGEVALPALLRPFPGCKAPQRDSLYRALAAFPCLEAAQVLVAGAGESGAVYAKAAQEALRGWPWAPLEPALRSALSSKRKGERLGAAHVLVARPSGELERALAEEFVAAERDVEVKALLERAARAAPAQEPADERPSASPLDARRRAMDPAWLASFSERLGKAYWAALGTIPAAPEEPEEPEEPEDGDAGEATLQSIDAPPDPAQVALAAVAEDFEDHIGDALKAWFWLQDGDPVDLALAYLDWVKALPNRNDFDWKRPWRAALRDAKGAPEFARLVCEVLEAEDEWSGDWGLATTLPLVVEPAQRDEVAGLLLARLGRERANQWSSTLEWLRGVRPAEAMAWLSRGLGSVDKYEAGWTLEQLKESSALLGQEQVLPHLWALLDDAQPGTRCKASEVLEALSSPLSVEPLKAALAKEGNAKAKQALRAALGACAPLLVVTQGATADTDAELDSALAALPEAQDKAPSFVPLGSLPALRWASGAALSEGAQRWVWVCATRETLKRRHAKLYEVRKRLDDASCWAAAAALDAAFAKAARGADARTAHLFAMALLADEAWAEEAGADLDGMAREGQSARAFLVLEALRRRGSPLALFWIDFYASSGKTPGLRARADEALTAITSELGVLQSELLRRAQPPKCGFDARGQRSFGQGAGALALSLSRGAVALTDAKGKKVAPGTAKKRPDGQALSALLTAVERASQGALGWCERAMVTGQRWGVEAWRGLLEGHPILGSVASGLLWRALDEAGAPRACFLWDDARSALALDGAPLAWEGVAAVDLPHPLLLDDEDKARAQALLAARKLAQPFEQLARATHRPQEGGPTPLALPEDKVIKAPKKLIQEAQALGYLSGTVEGGYYHEFWRPLAERWAIHVRHSGISVESRYQVPQVELEAFVVLDADGEPRPPDALPPLIFSEAMRDFVRLVP